MNEPTAQRRYEDEADLAAMELALWPRNEYPLIGEAPEASGIYAVPMLLRPQAE